MRNEEPFQSLLDTKLNIILLRCKLISNLAICFPFSLRKKIIEALFLSLALY